MTFEPECSFFLLLKSYLTNQTDSTQWIIFPSYQRNLHNYEFPVLFNLMFSNEKDYLVWVHLIAFHRSLSQYRVNTGTIFPVEIRSPFIGVSFLSSSVWAPFFRSDFQFIIVISRAHRRVHCYWYNTKKGAMSRFSLFELPNRKSEDHKNSIGLSWIRFSVLLCGV